MVFSTSLSQELSLTNYLHDFTCTYSLIFDGLVKWRELKETQWDAWDAWDTWNAGLAAGLADFHGPHHTHIISTGMNKGASTCGLPAPKTAKWPVVPLPFGCHRSLVHPSHERCLFFKSGSHKSIHWIGGFLWRFRGFTWFYPIPSTRSSSLSIIFLLKHIFLGGQCLQKSTTSPLSPGLQIPMVGLPGMTPDACHLGNWCSKSNHVQNENP